jgi:DNA-binding protein YbaB
MNQYNRLYALVQEIEANTARVEQAGQRALQEVVHQQVPGFGTVSVTAAGPVAIDLDRRAVRGADGVALGAAVTRAIVQAEAELRCRYEQTMAAARRDITA